MLDKVRDWFGMGSIKASPLHSHGHGAGGDHGHTHGVIDPTISTTERGIWAIKWSFVILAITAVLQIFVVIVSASVALLADTIHNFADATTAIPLWIAFRLAQRKPTPTFTYGYGRVEDLAGIAIVLIILLSAIVAGYEAIDRILHPQPISFIAWVALAGLIGFIGNEAVAVFRIRVGREINSAALIADGLHARTDGLTSLAVVIGAIGVWLGFPLADPIIGLLITAAIFMIVWQSAKSVLTRMLDGVEPGLVAEVRHSAEHIKGITKVAEVKARWLGHKLHVDAVVLTDAAASLAEADAISVALKNELFKHIPALSVANVRVHGSEQAISAVGDSHQQAGNHHHAPDPFIFSTPLASGSLKIVDTAQGERLRLALDHPVSALNATVMIDRAGGRVETLALKGTGASALVYESETAPEEPHEFSAQLRLASDRGEEVLSFGMREPAGHRH